MINVPEMQLSELQEIVSKKCSVAPSRAKKMVKVMENLQLYRSSQAVFSGKESIITVRDLIKWAGRVNDSHEQTIE